MTASSSRKVSRTCTSVPGHSSSSVFGMVARTGTVPVGGIDGVLDHRHLAAGLATVARDDRLDGRGLVGERLAQIRQTALRQREGDVDRRDLDDGRKRDRVGLAREVADLDVRHADAAGDRRADDVQSRWTRNSSSCALLDSTAGA